MNVTPLSDKYRHNIFDWQFMGFGLLVILSIGLNQLFMWTQSVDAFLYDNQLQVLPISADNDVVIIEIDEQSLSLLGDWPWPRSYHGEMINLLTQAEAEIIAYNVVFASADGKNPGDILLKNAIKNSSRTILPLYFDRLLKDGGVSEVLPNDMFQTHAEIGHVNSYLDSDGILRSMRLVDTYAENEWLHFSLVAYLVSHPKSEILSSLPSDIKIPFVNKKDFEIYSFVDVLTGLVPASELAQKTIFVGVTATSMGDPLLTPINDNGLQSPAVKINASIFQALKHKTLIQDLPVFYASLINIILVIFALYLVSKLSGVQQVVITIFALSLVWIGSYFLLQQGYWYRSAGLMISLIAIPFFWNILRLSRLFRYFRKQVMELQEKQKGEVFHLPEGIQLQSEGELKALLALLKVDKYRIIESEEIPLENKLSISKCVLIRIAEDEKLLELSFDEFTGIEKRKLNLVYQLVAQSAKEHEQKVISRESNEAVRTDIFSQQLALVESYQQQVAISHSLFEASIEGVSAGILVTDLIGRVLFKNKAVIDLVGCDIETLAKFFEKVPLSQGGWIERLTDVVLLQKPMDVEAKAAGKDFSISIRCIEDQQGLTPLLVFNLTDISVIKQAHRSRNEMIDFLSHDLRSPMASLQALVNHARNNDVISYSEIIDKVDHYSQRGLNFAEQFLRLAKVESEEDIQYYEVDLYSVSQNTLDTLYHQAKEKSILLNLDVVDDCWVMSNGDLLERILINLVSNAIKYSPEKSSIDISVSVQDGNDSLLEVRVSDQGPGISSELIPKLFKPYQRGLDKNTQKAKGVGLGLRFVDVALRKLGSEIRVDTSSKEGGSGASFYFYMSKITL